MTTRFQLIHQLIYVELQERNAVLLRERLEISQISRDFGHHYLRIWIAQQQRLISLYSRFQYRRLLPLELSWMIEWKSFILTFTSHDQEHHLYNWSYFLIWLRLSERHLRIIYLLLSK